MKIKSFRAETVASALKQVRQEMGGEALVLNTKRLSDMPNGNRVEITACVKSEVLNKSEEPKVAITSENGNGSANGKSNGNETISKTEKIDSAPSSAIIEEHARSIKTIHEKLDALNHRVITALMQNNRGDAITMSPVLVSKLTDADFTQDNIATLIGSIQNSAWSNSKIEQTTTLREMMVARFASMMKPDLKFKPGDRIMLIGPAGTGKSSVMGKLALHLVSQQGLKVKLSSLDNFKVGGHEEMASYADLLGVEMTDDTSNESQHAQSADCVTLIDSPALPTETNAKNNLIETIERINPSHRLLVVSATTRTADLIDVFISGLSYCPTHLVMTMTDLTHRFGALFSAAEILKRPMAFITDAPGGIGTIKTPDPDAMVRRILNSEGTLCKC